MHDISITCTCGSAFGHADDCPAAAALPPPPVGGLAVPALGALSDSALSELLPAIESVPVPQEPPIYDNETNSFDTFNPARRASQIATPREVPAARPRSIEAILAGVPQHPEPPPVIVLDRPPQRGLRRVIAAALGAVAGAGMIVCSLAPPSASKEPAHTDIGIGYVQCKYETAVKIAPESRTYYMCRWGGDFVCSIDRCYYYQLEASEKRREWRDVGHNRRVRLDPTLYTSFDTEASE